MRKRPWLTHTWRAVAVVGPAGAVLVVGWATNLWVERTREERTLVEQTGAVIEALDAAHADLLNAEVGERGYVLTGDSAFLEPYARSAAAIAGDLATLRTIIRDPVRRRHVDVLDSLMTGKSAELAGAVQASPGWRARGGAIRRRLRSAEAHDGGDPTCRRLNAWGGAQPRAAPRRDRGAARACDGGGADRRHRCVRGDRVGVERYAHEIRGIGSIGRTRVGRASGRARDAAA